MELILASILAFASTNIDDIFLLILFFGNKEYSSRQVILGQYLGIVALITISLIGSLIGLLFDKQYVGLLGILPIYFGIRALIRLSNHKEETEGEVITTNTKQSNKILSVAGVTFANGGDNLGIYIPLFATLTTAEKGMMVSIFLLMVALWCWGAKYLSKHPVISGTIDKYGHLVTPIVLILLGIYILYESGSFGILATKDI